MKIKCLNTVQGLKPLYDEDYEEKKKLKIGKVYTCEVKMTRNADFLNKYFALVRCAWEYQTEQVQVRLYRNSFEGFRKSLEIAAGLYEPVYLIRSREWAQMPKSVSFGKMTQQEFEKLYNDVLDVVFLLPSMGEITRDEFIEAIQNFI